MPRAAGRIQDSGGKRIRRRRRSTVQRRGMIGRRSGRIDVAWLLAAGFGGGLLCVVLLGRVPERAGSERGADPPRSEDSASLADAVKLLDQRLARIEASLAVQGARGEREAVSSTAAQGEKSLTDSEALTDLRELHEDLVRMSKRIDTLAESLLENRRPSAEYPTLEQMHSARADVDWKFVEDMRRSCMDNPAAAERARSMTFDDLLRKVGRPSLIAEDNGSWSYFHMRFEENGGLRSRGVSFRFVGDTVGLVSGF